MFSVNEIDIFGDISQYFEKTKKTSSVPIAHIGCDDWENQTYEDSQGFIYELTIEEELSKPFYIKGEASFLFKLPSSGIGKNMHIGLKIGKPHADIKHWHGIATEWSYNGPKFVDEDTSKKLYSYSFVIRPEVQFRLSKIQNRIFFPNDGGQNADGYVPFNKAKLMESIIENLIKANHMPLDNKINKDRVRISIEDMKKFYIERKNTINIKLQSINAASKGIEIDDENEKDVGDTEVDLFGKMAVDAWMDDLDADYKLHLYNHPRSDFINYQDKTNFETDEKEEYQEYIVQYNESDWDFLNRILRDFGIYYCFDHSIQHSGIVFYNNPQGMPQSDPEEEDDDGDLDDWNISGVSVNEEDNNNSTSTETFSTYIDYANAIHIYKPDGEVNISKTNEKLSQKFQDKLGKAPRNGLPIDGDVEQVYKMDKIDPFTESKPLHYAKVDYTNLDDKYIKEWKEVHQHVVSGVNTYGYNPDYDPEKRNILGESTKKNANDIYSETFTTEQKTKDYQNINEQYVDSTEIEYHATTQRQEVSPGYKFVLTHHPDIEMNGQYYVKRVTHRLFYDDTDGNSYNQDSGDEMKLFYENKAVFSKIDIPFKVKTQPRRQIMSVQTGIVVGPEDQELYTNDLGQVKVYFHWDNNRKILSQGEMLDRAIWIRVSQWGGAGNNWGGFFVPRIGQEVIISFENGNPNCPIITGCVYNRSNLPPYDMTTEDKNIKTGLKTKSLKETEDDEEPGFNELSFDDKASEEKIFLQAEKDYEEIIKDGKSSTIKTGSSELIIERGDRKITLMGEEEPTDGDGNDTLIIKNGNKEIKLESEEAKQFLTQILKGDKINKIDEGNYNLEITKGNKKTQLDEGDSSITISKGDMEINLDSGDKKETISGNKNLTINSGNYTIKISGGNMEISANQITYEAMSNLTLKSGGNLSIEAGGKLSIKGSIVEMESDTMMDVKASAILNIKGTMVNLN